VGPIAGLDAVEKRGISYVYQESNLGRLAHSPSEPFRLLIVVCGISIMYSEAYF
jgi:hypothetical protein